MEYQTIIKDDQGTVQSVQNVKMSAKHDTNLRRNVIRIEVETISFTNPKAVTSVVEFFSVTGFRKFLAESATVLRDANLPKDKGEKDDEQQRP